MKIKIILADDHRVVRHGLRVALEREPDIEILAEAENGRQAVELAGRHKPDLVLMDIKMPDMEGIEATRQVIRASPDTKVLALSMHAHRHYVMGMLEAGASGFVLKNCSFEELLQAIHRVISGQSHLSPEVTSTVITAAVGSSEEKTRPLSILTPRERQVLKMVAEGLANKVIAFDLGIGETTVESHRRQIMKKLDLHSVAELTKYAVLKGLTPPEP